MSTDVRLANLDDAAAICALNARELGYPVSLSDSTDALARALESRREVVVVAVSSGEVVGYCHGEVYRLLYAPPMMNVLGIAVRGQLFHSRSHDLGSRRSRTGDRRGQLRPRNAGPRPLYSSSRV